MTAPSSEGCVDLVDGRRLAWAQFGDPGGRPLLYFHGFPGSRLEAGMAADPATRHGIRVIAVDRPGYGGSDFKPGREITDWPADVAALADALGLRRFAVAGASGGGPYAAACALRLAERLDAAGIICGLGPAESLDGATEMARFNRLGLRLGRQLPWLSRPIFAALRPVLRHSTEWVIDRMARELTPPDREALARPPVRETLTRAIREGARRGSRGAARDGVLYSRPWGFRLGEIRIPVHLWHGERDVIVPVSMGRHVASRIPDCRAVWYPGEGHFSIIVNRIGEMMRVLLG